MFIGIWVSVKPALSEKRESFGFWVLLEHGTFISWVFKVKSKLLHLGTLDSSSDLAFDIRPWAVVHREEATAMK